jgi:putative ATP-dependent endonuclease of OLD family
MDYHGMGTRSWSSLLTFKSFIAHNLKLAQQKDKLFFPIIAIEEPEAHLHPNAQKQLYRQMNEMPGQKIISTHSPYIAGSAEFDEIRGISKEGDIVKCGVIESSKLSEDDIRKLRQKVVNTRGEIFFSKAIVLFEGETEEQALPILAEKYFERPTFECGIDFVGVGGAGQYFPFILFAESLNIPWYIFSDGEDIPIKNLKKSIEKINPEIMFEDRKNIFIIESGQDFEKMLISSGYIKEIEVSLKKLLGNECISDYIRKNDKSSRGRKKTENKCHTCNQYIYQDDIRNYTDSDGYNQALDDIMEKYKTGLGPIIASEIISSKKKLPPLVINLFKKIKKDFDHE